MPSPELTWQEGAGSLLLLAAAHETGLLEALENTLPVGQAAPTSRLAHSTRASRRRLLLTLLFLGAVGLQRTWDLRAYTSAGLAFLSGRKSAYSYRHVERFLSEVAQAGGAETLPDALAAWTTQLWKPATEHDEPTVPVFFLDGHRKPVFSDSLLPRGVIGRTSKILGCRALLLLHDAQGHPLLATTHRGDLHLTLGTPTLLTRYETATGEAPLRRLVIDREGMAAEFLGKLAAEGRWVVTILRTEQYRGLESFSDVGAFLPLAHDQAGQITREVAPARFLLPLPEQPGHFLPLTVALIRDWRAQVPIPPDEEDRPAYRYPPKDAHGRAWWMEDWEPTPTPSMPTAPKLIPIVTTAPEADPVVLAQLYRQRWPMQENILKDWLLPLGLDTNHGFAKTPVENSEVAKRQKALERRLSNIQRWGPKAHERAQRAARLSQRLRQETKAHSDALYRRINGYICEHDRGDEQEWRLQHKPVVKAMEAEANADLAERWRRYERARDRQEREASKHTRYCLEQCDLLGALAELAAKERAMYELENGKDQVMTVLKLALANLGMWVRAHYFPATYAHATWHRLAPFFRLSGRVISERQMVWVEVRSFNDRQLTRDLKGICDLVEAAHPRLPDGRSLCFELAGRPEPCSSDPPDRAASIPDRHLPAPAPGAESVLPTHQPSLAHLAANQPAQGLASDANQKLAHPNKHASSTNRKLQHDCTGFPIQYHDQDNGQKQQHQPTATASPQALSLNTTNLPGDPPEPHPQEQAYQEKRQQICYPKLKGVGTPKPPEPRRLRQ